MFFINMMAINLSGVNNFCCIRHISIVFACFVANLIQLGSSEVEVRFRICDV